MKSRLSKLSSKHLVRYSLMGIVFLGMCIWVTKEIIAKNNEFENFRKAPEFALLNQDSVLITQDLFKGKTYLVMFHYTRCPGVCVTLNKNMKKIYDQFYLNPNFRILSISVDPEYDTPSILKEKAQKLKINSNIWQMVTGDKDYIYKIAMEGYFSSALEDKDNEENILHAGHFLVINDKGYISSKRGTQGQPILTYDGTDMAGVKELIIDLKKIIK